MSSTEKGIVATMILEILGRPPEYLTETLNDIAKKIGEEKGTKVTGIKINPPVLMKDQTNFYTSFAEIDFETENLLYLAILMFKYMPAHIEILSPQNINLTNFEWNDILNELTRRLHGYEEIVRIVQNEKIILESKLREALGIKEEAKKAEEIKNSKKKKEKKIKKKK
jgi:hypothetical protein